MDDYQILIGAAPTSEEQQRAVAEMLRRRRAFGELGVLTGDQVLRPFGTGLIGQADKYASQIQETRQKDADNAQTKAYQDAQLKHMAAVLKETMRANNLDYGAQMAAIAQRNQDSILDFYGKGGTNYRKFTDSTRNKMLGHADTLRALDDQLAVFQPEYTQILGPGPQSALPNWAAQKGVGTQKSKDAGQWWSAWSKFYTLPTRNLLFGATLTPSEQAAWAAADINPSLSPEQIQTRIKSLMEESRKSALRRGRSMTLEGFDPEVIQEMYADVLPDADFGVPKASSTPGGPRGRRRSSSESTPAYSDDEIIQQMQELEAQLAGGQK